MKLPKQFERIGKIIAIALVVSLNGVGLLGVGDTVGFYLDIEQSNSNAFVAGNVDFTATSTGWNPVEVAVNMEPGDSTIKDFDIDPLFSNPFQYYAEATTSGDDAFCDGIDVSFGQDANTLYTGALSGLTTGTTTSTSTLSLSATTGLNNFQNVVCDVSLDFTGWQTRHDYQTLGGFNDTETINTKLASWGFRINKVYPDVDPERYVDGTSTESPNEWVEIYNQTSVDLDISDWKLCDNGDCDTIPSGTSLIPAMGYAVIVNNPNVFSATGTAPWYLPPGVVEIVLNSPIGNGLANTADMLQLKRPDGVVIDQMNWGTPTTSWSGYNNELWMPGVPAPDEGNLLARVPSGYDTNQASDWVEIEPPSVDLTYPDEFGSYTWYWDYSYTITWTATNPNGPDGDLNMSLFYIKDLDHTGSITALDTTHTIALTTENDGSYKWKVPTGFIGYIWIKLVATGPENPLNNSRTISGLIYDPVPVFVGPEGVDPDDVESDVEAPVITLYGNNPAVIAQGSVYADLGAAVTDNVDQNLGYVDEGSVDTETVGVYTITYIATDQAGNVGTAVRTVYVYDREVGPPTFEEETPVGEPEVAPVVASGGAAPEETQTETEEVPLEEEAIVEEESADEAPIVVEESETPAEETVEETTPEEVVEEETHVEEVTEEQPAIVEEEIPAGTEESVVEEEVVEVVEETPAEEETTTEEEVAVGDKEIVLYKEEEDSNNADVVVEEIVVEQEEEVEVPEVPEEPTEEVSEVTEPDSSEEVTL